jgi:ADP-ribosyltransferase exoenzyme
VKPLSGGAHVDSIQALEDLSLALSAFASDGTQRLEECASEIERQAGLLEERCRALARRVEYLQEEYDHADEDDDIGAIAYRLSEAEEAYGRALRWLRKVEEAAGEYARVASRAREVLEHRVGDACAFLRRKAQELKDYAALRPDAGSFGGASDSASRAAAGATGQRLKALIGPHKYEEYAAQVEAARAGSETLQGIPTEELVAIRGYSSEGYLPINKALRGRDPALLREYEPYIGAAKSGLEKLPDYEGTVYRGTYLDPNLLAAYHPGAVVTERGFTSTSASPASSYGGNAQYFINSRHGKDVSQVSASPKEREVLFPPGTKFQVVHIKRGLSGLTKIYMREL